LSKFSKQRKEKRLKSVNHEGVSGWDYYLMQSEIQADYNLHLKFQWLIRQSKLNLYHAPSDPKPLKNQHIPKPIKDSDKRWEYWND
jgi:hypothetical protein